MKKFSLLAATLGSTAAWYVLSNKKLRKDLAAAKTPEETVKVLQHYVGRDFSKIAKEVHELLHSDEVQEKIAKAKEVTEETFTAAKRGLGGLLEKGKRIKYTAMDKA